MLLLLQAEELGKDLASRRQRSVSAVINSSRQQLTPEQEAQLLAGTPSSRILDLLMSLATAAERIQILPDCFTPPAAVESSAAAVAAEAAVGVGTAAEGRAAAGVEQGGDSERIKARQGRAVADVGSRRQPLEATASAAAAAAEGEAVAGEAGAKAAAAAGEELPLEGEETEELWCTPLQLLNEINSRMKAVAGGGDEDGGGKGSGESQEARALLTGGGSHLSGEEYVVALSELRQHIAEVWLHF